MFFLGIDVSKAKLNCTLLGAEGGCIDATRECAQWVLPGTAQIVLPDA